MFQLDAARLVIDLDLVRRNVDALTDALGQRPLHFAVKCLPDPTVLRTLAEQGCAFEVASAGEIALLRDERLLRPDTVFSAPIKAEADIAYAASLGLDRFVADSGCELDKLARHAPGADVLLRLSVDSSGSVMPLSRKFGVAQDEVMLLAQHAAHLGLRVRGLTFHVGSQAEELDVWRKAIALAASTMDDLSNIGVRIRELDLGGGFPVPYAGTVPTVAAIGAAIRDALTSLPYVVDVVAEPGRYLVASAGTLFTRVVGFADRGGERWVYVNAGVFHGLAEASPGVAGLRYPVRVVGNRSGALNACVVAGHSCDGTDVIAADVMLPDDLAVGDELAFAHAGAYCLSYATNFCGIPSPSIEYVY